MYVHTHTHTHIYVYIHIIANSAPLAWSSDNARVDVNVQIRVFEKVQIIDIKQARLLVKLDVPTKATINTKIRPAT